jgi:hypothetical protein
MSVANDTLTAVRKGRIGLREAGNVSNSTSTARMKKLRVAHYIAVERLSGRSHRAQSEAAAKS